MFSLLAHRAREVIKSMLSFLKVIIKTVPLDLIDPHLQRIVEGLASWASDGRWLVGNYPLEVVA